MPGDKGEHKGIVMKCTHYIHDALALEVYNLAKTSQHFTLLVASPRLQHRQPRKLPAAHANQKRSSAFVMANPAQLAAQLESMQIDQEPTCRTTPAQTHYLVLKWPAPVLWPTDGGSKHIFLPRPANVERRSRPDEQSTHSTKLHDLHVALLAVQHNLDAFSTAPLLDADTRRLVDAIDNLKTTEGQSVLHVFSYSWMDDWLNVKDDAARHRFRLCPNEDAQAAQEFDLSHAQWQQLMNGPNSEPWVALLNDLITRSSDVAYLSARKALIAHYGTERVMAKEDSKYTDQWALQLPRPVEQLFLNRLQPLTAEDARLIGGNGTGQIRIRYPCGHQDRMRMIQIAAMTAQACFEKTCPKCGRKVVQQEDEHEAGMALTWQAGHTYKNFNHQWSAYDDAPESTHYRCYLLGTALFDAVRRAKESLDMPESVCRAAINPARFTETTKIIDHYQYSFGNSTNSWECTPLEVEQALFRLAAAALSGDVNDEERYPAGTIFAPPGYAKFLMLWIKRAVHFHIDLNDLDGTVQDERQLERDMQKMQHQMEEVEMRDDMDETEEMEQEEDIIV